MVSDTSPSQDAYTHQIWISYLKEYKRYAPNTIILKTRSEVKVKVTHKMVQDTPPSQDAFIHQNCDSYFKEYKRYAPNTIFLKLGQSSRSQWPEMVCDTPSSQDTFKHQIWNSYLKEIRRYAPDSMQFLETRSEVKFKVTLDPIVVCDTPRCIHTPNLRFLLQII